MGIVPKGTAPTSAADSDASGPDNVRHIQSGGHAGGRKSSRGYDPSTGEETGAKGYKPTSTRDSAVEYDVFTLVETNTYSESRFYTRSVNADGHGEKLQLRVPQGIDSQMHAAVAEVPEYKTLQDLVRDAVVHRLEYLQKRYSLSEGARRTLELERFTADAEAQSREIEELSATVDDIDAKLKQAWDAEDWQMLAEALKGSEERSEWLREPYKGRADKIIEGWKARSREQIKAMRMREK